MMTCRHLLPLVLALAAQFITRLHAQTVDEQIAAITTQFQEVYDRDLGKPHETAVADLDSKYAAALERALDASTSEGKLDEALKLREEKVRVQERKPIPTSDEATLPESLKTLRATYRKALAELESAKAEKARPFWETFDSALVALQTELTQSQRLDDALVVKAKRETIQKQLSGSTPASTAAVASTMGTSAWLTAAREKGGRLKLWGGPVPGKDIEVPTKAAKYDDFVSVNMYHWPHRVLFAKRKDGDLVILDFEDLSKIEVHEVKAPLHTSSGNMAAYVGKDRKVYFFDGSEKADTRKIKDLVALVYAYRFSLLIAADGSLNPFGMPPDFGMPPTDFLKGHKIVQVLSSDTIAAFLTDKGRVLCWDFQEKTPVTFEGLDAKNVRSMFGTFGFLTQDGEALFYGSDGKLGSRTFSGVGQRVLTKEAGPWFQGKGTGYFGAVQRPDGTWTSWKWQSLVPDQVKTLGPVLDLDAAEGGDAGILAWIDVSEPDPTSKP